MKSSTRRRIACGMFGNQTVIPYGPGMPYATVDSLPENCMFIAPNGGVYLKQCETISIITDDFEGVVLSDDSGNLLTTDNLSVILEN